MSEDQLNALVVWITDSLVDHRKNPAEHAKTFQIVRARLCDWPGWFKYKVVDRKTLVGGL